MWQEKENSSVQLSPLRPAAKDERKELFGLTSPKEPMCLADTCVSISATSGCVAPSVCRPVQRHSNYPEYFYIMWDELGFRVLLTFLGTRCVAGLAKTRACCVDIAA